MRNQRVSVVHPRQGPHSRKDPGARRRFAIWLTVCTIFLVWAGFQLSHQIGKVSEKRVELEQAEEELRKTEQLQHELKAHIQHLHDPDYVAELARKEYYMTKEGEIIFINSR